MKATSPLVPKSGTNMKPRLTIGIRVCIYSKPQMFLCVTCLGSKQPPQDKYVKLYGSQRKRGGGFSISVGHSSPPAADKSRNNECR